jgi:ABC-type nitrate/sulfonate/bicarbonate transport system substrate-binding protein
VRASVLATLLTLALSACGAATAAPSATATPLTVAYSNIGGDHLSSWVAKETGVFARNGLDVTLQLGGGGTKTAAALLANDYQLVEMGGSEAASAAANGADVVIVAAPSQVYIYKLIAAAGISSVAGLKGQKLGISGTGSSSDIAARVLLQHAGVDPKDVTFVSVGDVATRQAALLNGAVQAEMDAPPQSFRLESDPRFHVLVDLTAEKLPAVSATIVGQRSWVNANRPVVQRYVDSVIEGAVRVKQDKAAALAAMRKYTQFDDEQGLSAAYDFFSRAITADPTPRPADFKDTLDLLGRLNPKLRQLDPASIVDDSFARDALARGLGKPAAG